jgi:hypothetical protein
MATMSAPDHRDTQEVITLLRSAVTSSGLSQAAFAQALATSPSRLSTYISGSTRPTAEFCMRARRIGNALGAAAERGLMSAPATAGAMRMSVRRGDVDWVWRMLLQGRGHLSDMLARGEQVLIDSWEAKPGDAGSLEWSALLAAITQHEFERVGMPAPGWTSVAALDQPWVPEHPFLTPDRVRAMTPQWLQRLNLYVPERDLVTA